MIQVFRLQMAGPPTPSAPPTPPPPPTPLLRTVFEPRKLASNISLPAKTEKQSSYGAFHI